MLIWNASPLFKVLGTAYIHGIGAVTGDRVVGEVGECWRREGVVCVCVCVCVENK